MNTPIEPAVPPMIRRLVLIEVALVFVVFFVQGAVPVPDVNEPYYIGKAIHYWNPDWVADDFFLNSKDTHTVFYFVFGWMTLWLSPTVFAWFGRILTWWLLAWSWRRLSFAIAARRWLSILTAALFVCLLERCHLAGEWVVGGFEAKGFAFVLVFLGIEALVRNRFSRAWILLGAASAFHVLVGGWAVVALGLTWLLLGKQRPTLRSTWPAIVLGFVLSLPGLIPSALLNLGTDGAVVRLANQIYVYGRLSHHLAPGQLPVAFVIRFALLVVLWLILSAATLGARQSLEDGGLRRFRTFVGATVAIAIVGAAIAPLALVDQAMAAGLLRFYWFRLADVVVPMGVAMTGMILIVTIEQTQPILARLLLTLALVVGGIHLGVHAKGRSIPTVPPADRLPDYVGWRHACDWIADSGEIPADAKFLTPRMAQTFKWYTGRAEVANWKEVPQDAEAIVEWWQRIGRMHATGSSDPAKCWYPSLAQHGAGRLQQLGMQYGADYVLTRSRPRLPLEVVYPIGGLHRNRTYVVYKLAPLRIPE